MSDPVRRITDDSTKRKTEDRTTPPPELFREQLKVHEIDPEAQSKWKQLQQQFLQEDKRLKAPSPIEAMAPPTQQPLIVGSTPTSSQPSTQKVETTSYVPPPTPQTSTQVVETTPYVPPPPPQQTTQPLPSSLDFWDIESLPPPAPLQSSTSQLPQQNQGDTSSGQNKDSSKELYSLNKPQTSAKKPAPSKAETTKTAKESAAPVPLKTTTSTPTSKTKLSGKQEQPVEKTPSKKEATVLTHTPAPKKTSGEERLSEKERDFVTKEKEPLVEKAKQPQEKEARQEEFKGVSEATPQTKKTEDDRAPTSTQAVSMHLTPEIANAAAAATQGVSSYLSPKVESLFYNMVGVIMQATEKGVSKTEVVLNHSNLKSSVFYNSKITIEKYASAPGSWNIYLMTDQPKAFTLFNNNLDKLNTAFIQGNFDFKVGTLKAFYAEPEKEKFTFSRKEAAKEKDTGSQQQKNQ